MTDLTKINTPFGELDRATQGALLLAAHEGAEIELFFEDPGAWFTVDEYIWHNGCIYRVKPVPLTPDTIDWSQVADGWDWMARDEAGCASLFRAEPLPSGSGWVALAIGARVTQPSYRRGTRNWRDSLIRRPT